MQNHEQNHRRLPELSGRLIYADPRSLPSYPSVGLKDDSTAASIAAAIGWKAKQQQAPFDSTSSPSPPLLPLTAQSTATTTTTAAAAATLSRPPSRPSSVPANPDSLKAATSAASAAASAAAAALLQRPPSASPDPQAMAAGSHMSSAPAAPVAVEPPSSSEVGSTAGSSMAAATAAIGSASSRHQSIVGGGNESAISSSAAAMPSKPSAWGNSAANHAFKNNLHSGGGGGSGGVPPVRSPSTHTTGAGKEPSLYAAKGAMRSAPSTAAPSLSSTTAAPVGQRSRAISSPVAPRHRKSYSSHYPDHTTMTPAVAANTSSANALSAATAAHSSARPFSFVAEAGSVPYTTMDRQMYTATPPVALESEEKKHNEYLQASAVAMARRMYNPAADARAARSSGSGGEIGESSGSAAAPFASTLQEAAYKLAQERLEKLHMEHQKNRDYRDHYVDPKLTSAGAMASPGGGTAEDDEGRSTATMAGRFAVRSRLQRRRRASSDSEVVQERVQEQRQSLDQGGVGEVDYARRRRDRQSVLAVAQRNVRAQLQDIDEQVYANTGKVRPSLLAAWEHKAAKAAQARSDARLGAQPLASEVDLGGGRFMSRAEVDRIAAARVQPLLDEINEKAEQERERQAALKKDEQDRKEEALILKARDKEMKEEYQRLKREEKAAKKNKGKEVKETNKGAKVTGGEDGNDDDDDIDDDGGRAIAGGVLGEEVMTTADAGGGSSERRGLLIVSGGSPTSPTSPVSPASSASPASPASPGRLSKLFARTTKLQIRNKGSGETSSRAAAVVSDEPTAAPSAEAPAAAAAAISAPAIAASAATEPVVSTPEAFAAAEPLSLAEAADVRPATVPHTQTTASRSTAPEEEVTKEAPRELGLSGPNEVSEVAPAEALAEEAPEDVLPQSPQSPHSDGSSSAGTPKSRVRSWIKSRFARPRAKSSVSATSATAADGSPSTERSFIGGHTLTQSGAATSPATATAPPTLSVTTPASEGGAAAVPIPMPESEPRHELGLGHEYEHEHEHEHEHGREHEHEPIHAPTLTTGTQSAAPADASSTTRDVALAGRLAAFDEATAGADDSIPAVATPEAGASGSLWAKGTIGAIGAIGVAGAAEVVGSSGLTGKAGTAGTAEPDETAGATDKVASTTGTHSQGIQSGTSQPEDHLQTGEEPVAEKAVAGDSSSHLNSGSTLAEGDHARDNRASWGSHGGSSSIYSAQATHGAATVGDVTAATPKTNGSGDMLQPLVLTSEEAAGDGDSKGGGVRSGSVSPLTVPRSTRDLASTKSASPVRDSRFLEDLHETVI